jgi:hypothetical protein
VLRRRKRKRKRKRKRNRTLLALVEGTRYREEKHGTEYPSTITWFRVFRV